ncbi:MAG: tRNA pseudouridine(55) synthase TruB [Actinobacteria bacterium RBG_13_63_9]|nr:MAG: tRNA pseudouridine(55) synthase TruB [Actinobacteria bacterium RBG_13_63_9]
MSRVVLVDKPVGPTSFGIVRVARRGFAGRVGHAGTLDPFASGLLLVLLGQATRVSQLLMGLPKEYVLTVQFGAVSTTGDCTGDITPTGKRVKAEGVASAVSRFRGRVRQTVPMTSAVKVGGEALYRKAQRGETTQTPEREIMIYDLSLLGFDEETQTARLLALTGSGVYLRVLAQDLGVVAGAGGYAAGLRRSRIGRFSVADALEPEDLSPERYAQGGPGVLELDEALAFLPCCRLNPGLARLAANGNELPLAIDGRFRVCGGDELLGVYQGRAGAARPLVVFAGQA